MDFFAVYMRPSKTYRWKRRSGDKVRQTDLSTIAKTASLPVAYFGDLGWGSWTDGVTPAAFSDDTGFVELVERVRIGVLGKAPRRHKDEMEVYRRVLDSHRTCGARGAL